MRRLAAYVHVRAEDGRMVVFGPDDHVPDWAAAQMDDGCFVDGTPAGVVVTPPRRSATPPPTSGRGSSAAAWSAYAAAMGVDAAGTRGEVIAACDAAGIPTGQ